LASLLVVFAIGFFAAPDVFVDHDTATVTNAPGSSTPSCAQESA